VKASEAGFFQVTSLHIIAHKETGTNPTVVSYNASTVKSYNPSTVKSYNSSSVKSYNATDSLFYSTYFEKRSSLLQRWRCSCTIQKSLDPVCKVHIRKCKS
jgi:hypothetical protein